MIYERIGRFLRGRWQVPKAVIHVDANLSPSDIKMDGANDTKVLFLNTGQQGEKESLKLLHKHKRGDKLNAQGDSN